MKPKPPPPASTPNSGNLPGGLAAALGGPGGDSLVTLVSTARRRLNEADNINARRDALAKGVLASRRAAAKAAAALTAAQAALGTWSAQWRSVLDRLGRPATEAPDATASVLDRLVALPTHVAAAEDGPHPPDGDAGAIGPFRDDHRRGRDPAGRAGPA